jgi:hypothetical protein
MPMSVLGKHFESEQSQIVLQANQNLLDSPEVESIALFFWLRTLLRKDVKIINGHTCLIISTPRVTRDPHFNAHFWRVWTSLLSTLTFLFAESRRLIHYQHEINILLLNHDLLLLQLCTTSEVNEWQSSAPINFEFRPHHSFLFEHLLSFCILPCRDSNIAAVAPVIADT